jgi:hypothetical protein
MGRGIVKLADNFYVEWSTVVDAPVTYGMTRPEMLKYIMSEYKTPQEGAESRLARADTTGTSFHGYENIDSFIAVNRAGPNESRLTLPEMIAEYTYKPQQETIEDLEDRIKAVEAERDALKVQVEEAKRYEEELSAETAQHAAEALTSRARVAELEQKERIDRAFYNLTVKERDAAWAREAKLCAQIVELKRGAYKPPQDRTKVLEEALQEIARPARGGIEANDSDEDWIDYLVQKCNRYQALARGALEHE